MLKFKFPNKTVTFLDILVNISVPGAKFSKLISWLKLWAQAGYYGLKRADVHIDIRLPLNKSCRMFQINMSSKPSTMIVTIKLIKKFKFLTL